jgi:hypothetical protein
MSRRKFYASDGMKYRTFTVSEISLEFEPQQRWLNEQCPRYVAAFLVRGIPNGSGHYCRRLTGGHQHDGSWDELEIIWERLPPKYERYEFKRTFRQHVQNQLRMLVSFGLVKVPGPDGVFR